MRAEETTGGCVDVGNCDFFFISKLESKCDIFQLDKKYVQNFQCWKTENVALLSEHAVKQIFKL